MDLLSITVNVVTAVGGFALFAFILWRIARWARRRPTGAFVLGALIIPIGGMGNVSDPDFRMVNEAQRPKRQEEDDSGDSPESLRETSSSD
jgi:hypothetical protein